MTYQHNGGGAASRVRPRSNALIPLALTATALAVAGCADSSQTSRQAASSCFVRQAPVTSLLVNVVNGVTRGLVGKTPSEIRPMVGSMNIPGVMTETVRWLGPQVACSLNNPADQNKAVEAVKVATITGHVQTWSGSEPGISGSAKLVQSNGDCRTVQQTVNLSDGTQRVDDVKSCKGSSGWEVVQS